MTKGSRYLGACFLVMTLIGCAHTDPPSAAEISPLPGSTLPLSSGWSIQSSAATSASGSEIATPRFDSSGWFSTEIPSIVFAALVRNGAVPDPFEAKNLETLPREPYDVPWWYRTEFVIDELPADARLVFEGINYSANIWLNGKRIAGRDEIVGSFRVFELDVTDHLSRGANALAVEVFPPQPGDPTIGFVDWNPSSPDDYMGLWRGVTLEMTSGVALDDVFVRGEVDPANLEAGQITIETSLANRTGRPVTALVRGRVHPEGIAFERTVQLTANENLALILGPDDFPQLAIHSPRLWWPVNLGEPNLYSLQLEAVVDGTVSDRHEITFGIRHVEDYINEAGHRGYRINGRPVLIRGGGWVDDVLLIEDPQRLEDQIRYVRHMNLNTIRLEGFWGNTHELYDLADRYGIMVWVGWSCQWEWEDYLLQPVDATYGGIDTPEEMDLIVRSWNDQVIRLRNHPSVVVWNLASDMLPNPTLERRYLDELARIDPTRPALGACSTRTSEVSGPTAVKMNGPYEWEPPNYWYDEKAPGGAFGFNTETGPGAQPPVAASIRRMLPEENWWPIDDMWDYHAARKEFGSLDRYVTAMNARYGPAEDLDDFALKAQMVNYEAMLPMFESFSLRRPLATGVVQWMLNAAWPKMFWQFYDYYLVPTGAFYAARDANRPVHIALDHGTREIVAVNDTGEPLRGTARVRVLDSSSRVLFDERRPVNVGPHARDKVLPLPASASGQFHFVDARIEGSGGDPLASNFYWLPARPDVLDWENNKWFYTPTKEFADLKAVNDLPPARISVDHRFLDVAEGTEVEVTLRNDGPHLAFFIELEVAGRESGRLAAPIFWDDNYISVLPGESRTVRATFPPHALEGEAPVFRYQGMNIGGTK